MTIDLTLLPEVKLGRANGRRTMKTGVMCGRPQGFVDGSPEEALAFVQSSGYEGVLFATPRAVSPELDSTDLKEAGELASEMGLFLETGIGSLGPFGDARERIAELNTMIDGAVALGCNQFFAYTRTERRHSAVAHSDQLATIQQTIEALLPRLRSEGLRLNLKTHEDLSSHEVLRLVEACGPDVVGVSLDVANLVVRGEDPVEATRRLAPHIYQTHLEDVALYPVERGLRRVLRMCGTGVLDWFSIIRTLLDQSPAQHLTIEQHLGRFDADVFDPLWFSSEPHVAAPELAVLFAAALECERRVAAGDYPSLTEISYDPGMLVRRDQLGESARYLRQVLDTISGGHHGHACC